MSSCPHLNHNMRHTSKIATLPQKYDILAYVICCNGSPHSWHADSSDTPTSSVTQGTLTQPLDQCFHIYDLV